MRQAMHSIQSHVKDTIPIKARIKDRKSDTGYTVDTLQVLCPLSFVRYLWNDIGVNVSPDTVKEFWRHNRSVGAPWAVCHPATDEHVPLAVYGDSCKVRSISYQAPEKIVGVFLSCPLWKPRSVRASRWLLFSIEESRLYQHQTIDRVLAYVTWALNCLFTGRWPHCGMNGEEFEHGSPQAQRAGQWIISDRRLQFALTELRGDWLWYQGLFRLRSSWKSGTNFPLCYLCPAMSRGPDRYYDVKEGSVLWTKELSFPEFLVKQIPQNKASPLLAAKGFHHTMLRHCSMHVLNLGLLYGANGSCLMCLIEDGFFLPVGNDSLQSRLDVAYQDFRAWCHANRINCSQPPFTVKLVLKKGQEVLLTAKAYNNRVICSWLAHVLDRAQSIPGCDDRIPCMFTAMNAMSRFFLLSETYPRFLTQDQANALHREGERSPIGLFVRNCTLLVTSSRRSCCIDATPDLSILSSMRMEWVGSVAQLYERIRSTSDAILCELR